jgi:hypothetical protein
MIILHGSGVGYIFEYAFVGVVVVGEDSTRVLLDPAHLIGPDFTID